MVPPGGRSKTHKTQGSQMLQDSHGSSLRLQRQKWIMGREVHPWESSCWSLRELLGSSSAGLSVTHAQLGRLLPLNHPCFHKEPLLHAPVSNPNKRLGLPNWIWVELFGPCLVPHLEWIKVCSCPRGRGHIAVHTPWSLQDRGLRDDPAALKPGALSHSSFSLDLALTTIRNSLLSHHSQAHECAVSCQNCDAYPFPKVEIPTELLNGVRR